MKPATGADVEAVGARCPLQRLRDGQTVAPDQARLGIVDQERTLSGFVQLALMMVVTLLFVERLIADGCVYVARRVRVRAELAAHGAPAAPPDTFERVIRSKLVHEDGGTGCDAMGTAMAA